MSRILQWATLVCLLCLAAAPLSAAQHVGQHALHPRTLHTAADRVNKHFLLEDSTSSTDVTTVSGSAAAAPASKPTILQATDVTFRLVGKDAQPFSRATAQAFQQALHAVFSNFSSATFAFQSATVMSYAVQDVLLQNDVPFKRMYAEAAQQSQNNLSSC